MSVLIEIIGISKIRNADMENVEEKAFVFQSGCLYEKPTLSLSQFMLSCTDMPMGPDRKEDQETDGWITLAKAVGSSGLIIASC